MSILDRKPVKYSTSDLFWVPNAAPNNGIEGDITPSRLTANDVQFAQDVIFDTNGVVRSRSGFNGLNMLTAGAAGVNYLNATVIAPSSAAGGSAASVFGVAFIDATNNQLNFFASAVTSVQSLTPQNTGSLLFHGRTYLGSGSLNLFGLSGSGGTSTALFSPVVDICNLHDNTGAIITVNGYISSIVGTNYVLGSSYIWCGNLNTTINNTGTFTSVIGSKAVVGVGTAWTSALENSYLFATGGAGNYVGKVQKVLTGTTLTLDKGSTTGVAGAVPGFFAAKSLGVRIYKGRITTTTGSTTVVGSNTKFKASTPVGATTDLIADGNAAIYRYRDGAFIGSIAAAGVANDTTLTLNAAAAIAVTNEEYYIKLFNTTVDSTFYGPQGVDYYANRYWVGGVAKIRYEGNSAIDYPIISTFVNSVFFSKQNDPECWDLDEVAGDIITLPAPKGNDQIRGIKATRTGLLIFRTNDTFILTGFSPETFVLRKVLDDGCLNTMTIKKYKNGIMWPGYLGVYYFDGTNVINVLQNRLVAWYKKAVLVVDKDGAGGSFVNLRSGTAMVGDYFMISWTAMNGSTELLPSGAGTTQQGAYTMVINMLNGSISFFSNIRVANSVDISGSLNSNTTPPTLVLTHAHPFTKGSGTPKCLQGEKIFQDLTASTNNFDGAVFTDMTSGQTGPANGGPVPIIHSQGYTIGDATRLKFWKMFLVNYISNVPMSVAYYGQPLDNASWPPLDTGAVALTGLPTGITSNILKRVKFLLRSPVISFRIYPTSAPSASTSQRFKLFWWKVGGKQMRQGRV